MNTFKLEIKEIKTLFASFLCFKKFIIPLWAE